jgi:SAM-dependent methyltransferase
VLVMAVVLVIMCFAAVVFVGPPYLPTLSPQVKVALDMLGLKPGQTMLELGCGDGKVLIAAAQRGWKVTGIELNPILVLVCKLRTWRYRQLVTVRWGNYWDTRLWGRADGIFGFVLPRYMTKLDKIIVQWKQEDVKLASFAFAIPDKPVVRESHGVFLYEYRQA